MNHAVATALLGSKSLTDVDAIHEAWRLQVARNPDRLEMLNTAKDVLVKNVDTVLKNLWPASDQPTNKRKRTRDMPITLPKFHAI
jgi:hypothetical protein